MDRRDERPGPPEGRPRPPSGALAEIFLDTAKTSAIGDLAQEAAILASLAMQHDCAVATLRHALESAP